MKINILRIVLLIAVLSPSFSFADQDCGVKITLGEIKFLQSAAVVLPVSAEQQQLSEQLQEAAKNFNTFEDFEKHCRKALNVPKDPTEQCLIYNEIEERIKHGDSPENIGNSFSERIKELFYNGYMVSGNQMTPVKLFLRQYYDDFKAGQLKGSSNEMDNVSFKQETSALPNSKNVIRVTVAGEDSTERGAIQIAIKEASLRGGTYWNNRLESTETFDGKQASSRTTETTVVISESTVRRYDVLSCVKTSEGKYRVTIAADIEKSIGSDSQNIKTANLLTEYERITNENKTAKVLNMLRNNIPDGLIDLRHDVSIPEMNLISISCTLSVNLKKYQQWVEQIHRHLSRIAVTERSYATRSEALTDFFENNFSNDRKIKKCLFIGNIRNGNFQYINTPNTVFYQKYELRKNLIREITSGFTCKPVIVIELVDNNKNLLIKKTIPFEESGIRFLQENATLIPAIRDEQLSLQSCSSSLWVPFLFDKTGKISSSKVRIPIELHLASDIFRKQPDIRIYVAMSASQDTAIIPSYSEPKDTSLANAKEQYNAGNYNAACTQFRKLAEQGNSEAIYYMGLLAVNWKNNLDEAVFWLSKNSDALSLNLLGDVYLKKQNQNAALQVYRQSAESGNLNGKGRYGKLLMKSNPKTGIKYLVEAADGGNRSSCYYAAEYYRANGLWNKAFTYYRKALRNKNTFLQYNQCMYYVGFCHAHGLGTPVNVDEALFCLNKVSYRGIKYAEAQYYSGILKKKIGKKREALEHFQEAARMKHPGAMYEYGAALLSQNVSQGYRFLQQAVSKQPEFGFDAGIELLKRGYQEKAGEMFRLCAAVPNVKQAMAFFQLGKIAGHRAKAIKYYQQAAKLKLPEALYLLGEMELRSGNLDKAHRYFLDASGYAKAEFSHAQLHENKNFSGFSLKEALFRYTKAYAQSREEKKQELEREALKNIRRIERILQSIKQ